MMGLLRSQPHSKHKNAETVQASRKKTAPIAIRCYATHTLNLQTYHTAQNPSDQLSLNCQSQNNSKKCVRVMSQLRSCARLPRVRRSFQSIRASSGRYSRDENYSSDLSSISFGSSICAHSLSSASKFARHTVILQYELSD